jgi:hypothetical protein
MLAETPRLVQIGAGRPVGHWLAVPAGAKAPALQTGTLTAGDTEGEAVISSRKARLFKQGSWMTLQGRTAIL